MWDRHAQTRWIGRLLWAGAAVVIGGSLDAIAADAPRVEEEPAPADVAAALEEHSVAATLVLPHNYLSGTPWDVAPLSREETIEVLSRPLPPVTDANRALPAVQVIEQTTQRRIVCLNPGPDDPEDDFAGIGYATRLKRAGTYGHFMQRGESDAMTTVGGVLVGLITLTSEAGRPVAASFVGEADASAAEAPASEPSPKDAAYFIDVLLMTRDYILIIGVPVDDQGASGSDAAETIPEDGRKGLFDKE